MRTEPLPSIPLALQTLFERFDLFADAPNAVAKLREIISQFAVRGLLSERLNGESCSNQIQAIDDFRSLRKRRIQTVKSELPFSIPESWRSVTIGDSMEMINGKAFKPEQWSTEGTPIIRIQNLNNESASFNYCEIEIDTKFHVNDGDFLISWSGTPGTSFGAFIWSRGLAYLNQHIFRCELVDGVFVKKYLRLAINARLDEMISHAQGAVGLRHITKGKLESIPLPLPPLAEQKRIVAKVDELMALCDRLEEQQRERGARHASLVRASLARFTAAPTPANLDFLFFNSYTIPPAELRKAILTLAVQGKLVPQDLEDEPAETLCHRIQAEIKRSVNHGTYKAIAPLPPVRAEEQPFSLPSTWKWCRLRSLSFVVGDGLHGTPEYAQGTTCYFINGNNLKAGRIIVGPRTKTVSLSAQQKHSKTLTSQTILISINGTIGSVAFYDGECIVLGKSACYINLSRCVDKQFLRIFIESPFFSAYATENATGTTIRNLGLKAMNRLPVPLPPLTEQHRIVAKVDQLMALVDQLETQLAASQSTAKNLLEAVVAELTAA